VLSSEYSFIISRGVLVNVIIWVEGVLSSGMIICYHLSKVLSSQRGGAKCYHLGRGVLSPGIKCYHLSVVLSSQKGGGKCYHLGRGVII